MIEKFHRIEWIGPEEGLIKLGVKGHVSEVKDDTALVVWEDRELKMKYRRQYYSLKNLKKIEYNSEPYDALKMMKSSQKSRKESL